MEATVKEAPPVLHFTMTGETFEFQTSAKAGDGVFRFRWTLGEGSAGPPEHTHVGETETFAVVSGALRVWVDGAPHDLGPGRRLAVAPGAPHRFLSLGPGPAVVDVSLDGARMEDALVPLAYRLGGRTAMRLSDVVAATVHEAAHGGSKGTSRAANAAIQALAGLFRAFGARPLPLAGPWAAGAPAARQA